MNRRHKDFQSSALPTELSCQPLFSKHLRNKCRCQFDFVLVVVLVLPHETACSQKHCSKCRTSSTWFVTILESLRPAQAQNSRLVGAQWHFLRTVDRHGRKHRQENCAPDAHGRRRRKTGWPPSVHQQPQRSQIMQFEKIVKSFGACKPAGANLNCAVDIRPNP